MILNFDAHRNCEAFTLAFNVGMTPEAVASTLFDSVAFPTRMEILP